MGQRRRELEAQLGHLGSSWRRRRPNSRRRRSCGRSCSRRSSSEEIPPVGREQQTQAQLRQQLEEARSQLQAQKKNYLAEQSRLEARTKELQAAQPAVEQKVASLTETLAQRPSVERAWSGRQARLANAGVNWKLSWRRTSRRRRVRQELEESTGSSKR